MISRCSERGEDLKKKKKNGALSDACFFFLLISTTHLSIIIGLEVRVFANGPGDLGSIPGRVIPKTQKMVLVTSLLNTQHYKVLLKSKVTQSRESIHQIN